MTTPRPVPHALPWFPHISLVHLISVALAVSLVAAACGGSTAVEEPGTSTANQAEAETEPADASESDGTDQASDTGQTGEDGGATDEETPPADSRPGPITAAEAIEKFGPLEQPWTGPLTGPMICDDFPTEHILAVLGLTEDRVTIKAGTGSFPSCEFFVDDEAYRGFISPRTVERDLDWGFLVSDARGTLPLDVGDQGIVGERDRPSAATRDGSVGLLITTNGVNGGDPFVIDQVLMKEFLTILSTRWSFDTQQGDVVEYRAPEENGESAAEPDNDPNGTDPNGTDPNGTDPNGNDPNGLDRDALAAEIAEIAPIFTFTDEDQECLIQSIIDLGVEDPNDLEQVVFFELLEGCGLMRKAVTVTLEAFLGVDVAACLIDVLTDDEIDQLAQTGYFSDLPEDERIQTLPDLALELHPECAES